MVALPAEAGSRVIGLVADECRRPRLPTGRAKLTKDAQKLVEMGDLWIAAHRSFALHSQCVDRMAGGSLVLDRQDINRGIWGFVARLTSPLRRGRLPILIEPDLARIDVPIWPVRERILQILPRLLWGIAILEQIEQALVNLSRSRHLCIADLGLAHRIGVIGLVRSRHIAWGFRTDIPCYGR